MSKLETKRSCSAVSSQDIYQVSVMPRSEELVDEEGPRYEQEEECIAELGFWKVKKKLSVRRLRVGGTKLSRPQSKKTLNDDFLTHSEPLYPR